MALEFPSNPTNGQLFDDYFYDASIGAWRGIGSPNNLGVQVAALQTANATTNRAGLVPVSPTSVTVGSGSATISSSGLVTFNNTSTLLLNGVFNANYRNYRMILNMNSSSADYDLAARWSTNGTASTAGTYFNAGERRTQGGASISYGGGPFATQWFIGGGQASYNSGTLRASIDIYSPFIVSATYAISNAFSTNPDSSGFNLYNTGNAQETTSRDGIQIYPTSGNITGTLQVYGYRD